jgi:hypothetical protein
MRRKFCSAQIYCVMDKGGKETLSWDISFVVWEDKHDMILLMK